VISDEEAAFEAAKERLIQGAHRQILRYAAVSLLGLIVTLILCLSKGWLWLFGVYLVWTIAFWGAGLRWHFGRVKRVRELERPSEPTPEQ